MQIRLNRKVAMITGGSMGMGRAMALKLATAERMSQSWREARAPEEDSPARSPRLRGRCRAYPADVSEPGEMIASCGGMRGSRGSLEHA